MGLSKKVRIEEIGLEAKGKIWVIAGIAVRGPLRCIPTKRDEEDEENDEPSKTPTAKEARIPERLHCPPVPRKRPQTASCHFNGVREFFTPPDLESVFIRHVKRAN